MPPNASNEIRVTDTNNEIRATESAINRLIIGIDRLVNGYTFLIHIINIIK